MNNIVVRAYMTGKRLDLLATIPYPGMNHILKDGYLATDSQFIASAMGELRNQGRFTDAEIESFRYRVDRPRHF